MIRVLARASNFKSEWPEWMKVWCSGRDKLMGYAKDVSIFLNLGTGVELHLLIFSKLLLIIYIISLASVSINCGLDG